jgi:Bacterial Ig domain/Bacterial cadherin-like domain
MKPNIKNETFANDDANSGPVDVNQNGNVLSNDTDPEGNPQTVTGGKTSTGTPIVPGTEVALPSGGKLTINANGTYVYKPAPGFVGTETVEYSIKDSNGAIDKATLILTTIPVPAPNDTEASNDINQTPKNTPVSGSVKTNDEDAQGDSFTVTELKVDLDGDGSADDVVTVGSTTPVYGKDSTGAIVPAGTLKLNADGTYTFTPNATFVGTVPAQYTNTDSKGAKDSATLTIEIRDNVPTKNDAPIANDDTNTTEQGKPVSANVISPNDSDSDGDPLTVTQLKVDSNGDGIPDKIVAVGTPTPVSGVDLQGNPVVNAGTLVLNPDGTYTFTPTPSFTGKVVSEYTIKDPEGKTDPATLTIDVVPNKSNEVFANDDANSGPVNVTQTGTTKTNDNDPEGDTFAITAGKTSTGTLIIPGTEVTLPSGGKLTLNADGTYVYKPATGFIGTEVVEYTVTDANGATDKATLYLTTFPKVIVDDCSVPKCIPVKVARKKK